MINPPSQSCSLSNFLNTYAPLAGHTTECPAPHKPFSTSVTSYLRHLPNGRISFQASDASLDILEHSLSHYAKTAELNTPNEIESILRSFDHDDTSATTSGEIRETSLFLGLKIARHVLNNPDLIFWERSSDQAISKGLAEYALPTSTRHLGVDLIASLDATHEKTGSCNDSAQCGLSIYTTLKNLWSLARADGGLIVSSTRDAGEELQSDSSVVHEKPLMEICRDILFRMEFYNAERMIYGVDNSQVLLHRISPSVISVSRVIVNDPKSHANETSTTLDGCIQPNWRPMKLAVAAILTVFGEEGGIFDLSYLNLVLRFDWAESRNLGHLPRQDLSCRDWASTTWTIVDEYEDLSSALTSSPPLEDATLYTLGGSGSFDRLVLKSGIGGGGTYEAFRGTIGDQSVVIKIHDFATYESENSIFQEENQVQSHRFKSRSRAMKHIIDDVNRYQTILLSLQDSVIPRMIGIVVGRCRENSWPVVAIVMEDAGDCISGWHFLLPHQRWKVLESYAKIHQAGIAQRSVQLKHILISRTNQLEIRIIDFDHSTSDQRQIELERIKIFDKLGGRAIMRPIIYEARMRLEEEKDIRETQDEVVGKPVMEIVERKVEVAEVLEVMVGLVPSTTFLLMTKALLTARL